MRTILHRAFLAAIALVLIVSFYECTRPLFATEVTGVSTLRMLNAVTTGSAQVTSAFMPRCRETAIYVQWSTGVNAGAVTIETAHSESYTGTFAPLQIVTWAGSANKEDVVQITGIHGVLATRVSSTVMGGTVTTWAVCN